MEVDNTGPVSVRDGKRLLARLLEFREAWQSFATTMHRFVEELTKQRFEEPYDLSSFAALGQERDKLRTALAVLKASDVLTLQSSAVRRADRVLGLSLRTDPYLEILQVHGRRGITSFEQERSLVEDFLNDLDGVTPWIEARIQTLQDDLDDSAVDWPELAGEVPNQSQVQAQDQKMTRSQLHRELQALYAQRDSLSNNEDGGQWLAHVAALIDEVDSECAEEIRSRAKILTLPLSRYTIEPHWTLVLQMIRNTIARLETTPDAPREQSTRGALTRRVFVGHGRSAEWMKLKDFLVDRLRLEYEEFNRESPAGYSTKERLDQMLATTSFAFLVMTAEDQHADGTHHARENVIHEIGLFQGRHGFARAIVLLEEGCVEFSNIVGLSQIRFPKGDLLARSEEVRRVLEREGLLT